jgi:hypothetical protein
MSLMNPQFKYVKSGETDIRKTFARIRREMKEAEAIKQEPKVRALRPAKKGGT